MSWRCSVALLVALAAASSFGLDLNVDPPGFSLIPEDTNKTLTLSLHVNNSDPLDEAIMAAEPVLIVTVVPDEEWKLDFVNSSVSFTPEDIAEERNKSIVLSGYYWGRTQLSFYLIVETLNHTSIIRNQTINGSLLRDDVSIGVNRAFSVVDNIFMTVATSFVFVNTINMGAQLNLEVIKECLRKPLGPICGFISQFGFMPPFSFWIGYLFFTNPLYRLGLFTLGCSPGGLMSNLWTLIYDGDINLSITMTFVSTIAAMGMMPLWMFTLGKLIVKDNENLQIPFKNLIISLVSLTVPLAIGIFIQYKRPLWAQKIGRFIKPFTLGILLFLLTVGIYNSYKILLIMTIAMYIAGFIIAISGFLFGATFASSFCLKRNQVIAISIETAMQNVGVAYIVLKLSLQSPDGDIASLPLMAQAMLTGIGLQVVFWTSTAFRFLCCRSSLKKDTKEKAGDELKHNKDADVVTALMISEDAEKEKRLDMTQASEKSKRTINLQGFTKKMISEEI